MDIVDIKCFMVVCDLCQSVRCGDVSRVDIDDTRPEEPVVSSKLYLMTSRLGGACAEVGRLSLQGHGEPATPSNGRHDQGIM